MFNNFEVLFKASSFILEALQTLKSLEKGMCKREYE